MFLIDSDYSTIIRNENLEKILNSDTSILPKAELIAIEEISNYLRIRYDTDKIFSPIYEYNINSVYLKDTRILYTDDLAGLSTLYYVTADTSGAGASITDTTQFAVGDTRNPLIVMYTVDIVLYHICSAIAPRQIPELRLSRYEAVKEWLKQMNEATISANLPLYAANAPQNDRFVFGSNKKFRVR